MSITVKLRDLKGLGPKSEMWLHEVGINTPDDLRSTGAIRVFIRLKKECSVKPSLLFLYAIVGAIEDRHWAEIAKNEKSRLITELEGYRELEELLEKEGATIEI
jgi:DNA transformation protein